MQLAASVNLELVRVLGFLDAQRDVGQRLAQEPLADLPAGEETAFAPAKGELFTSKVMLIVGSSTTSGGSGSGLRRVAERVRDRRMLDAGEGHDVARRRFLDLDAIEPEEAQDLHHPLLTHRAGAIDDRDRHVAPERAAF